MQMKENKFFDKLDGTIVTATLVGFVMTVLLGCVSPSRDLIDNGQIVVKLPFDLEIGSAEYVKVLGSLIRPSSRTRYDSCAKKTITNWYYYAEAKISPPYYGCNRLKLAFTDDKKELEYCGFIIRGDSITGRGLSYAECREIIGKIIADIGSTHGVRMRRTCDSRSEMEEQEHVREILDDYEHRKEECYGCVQSFVCFMGKKAVNDIIVDYRVYGMLNWRGGCEIYVEYFRRV